jgi:1,5-anhydro-D-fructose reductase (1,5-anhydro-D-mannitol-forming)
LSALRSLNVVVDAICEPSSVRREAAIRSLPSARVYETLDSLLSAERSLDALIVCSPPSYHGNGILAGIRAGIHVLCEKPLTLDPEAFAQIQTESASRNVCVYSINNWAFSPQWSRLLEVAASGRLGAIRHVDIRVLRTRPSVSASPNDWRKDPAVSGGGIFVDHGWHNLYLMRRLLGSEASIVDVVLHPRGSVDEVATALFAAAAASGTMHLSWRAGERSNSAFVAGEKGSAELRDDSLIVKAEGLEEVTRFPEKLSGGSAHPEWLAAMWPSFEAECAGVNRGANLAEAEFCLTSIRTAYARETSVG